MLKKVLKIFGIVIILTISVVFVIYALLVLYFTDRFNTHTYINGIDATGMTIREVNDQLAEASTDYEMSIVDYDGEVYSVKGDEIGFYPNYYEQLSDIMEGQNQYTWFLNVVYPTAYEVSTKAFYYDTDKLGEVVTSIYPFQNYDNSSADVHIVNNLGKYFLIDETRDVLDASKAKSVIYNAIACGADTVSLEECYTAPVYTAKQQETVSLFAAIDKYQSTDITYTDSDIVRHLDFTETNKWLMLDENLLPYMEEGRLAVNRDRVSEFVESLSATFGTADDIVTWTRKDGTTVDLPYSGDGYRVNGSAEYDRLVSNLYSGNTYERRPIYSKEGFGRGNDIVGKDYVEVDFEHQKMYCYIGGKLKLSSDVVTGNLRYGYDTPAMISPIYFMQKGRTLRGENYATFVYNWMAFYNHYGLHDATWRKSFGGDIYKTNGSHGCVNLPKDVADELYELVYVGMPVVLYYGDDKE